MRDVQEKRCRRSRIIHTRLASSLRPRKQLFLPVFNDPSRTRRANSHDSLTDPLLLDLPLQLDLFAPAEQRTIVAVRIATSVAVVGTVDVAIVVEAVKRGRRTSIVEKMRRRGVERVMGGPVPVMMVPAWVLVSMEVRRRRAVVVREREMAGRREKGERARVRVRAAVSVMMRVVRL